MCIILSPGNTGIAVYSIICSIVWKLVSVFKSGVLFSNIILNQIPQSFCLLKIALAYRMVSESANKISYR